MDESALIGNTKRATFRLTSESRLEFLSVCLRRLVFRVILVVGVFSDITQPLGVVTNRDSDKRGKTRKMHLDHRRKYSVPFCTFVQRIHGIFQLSPIERSMSQFKLCRLNRRKPGVDHPESLLDCDIDLNLTM